MVVRKFISPLTVAVLSILPGAGFATDLPVKSNAQPAKLIAKSANWMGPYVGVSAGYDVLTTGVNVADILKLDGFGAKGYAFGGLAGYNFAKTDNVVFGLEISGQSSDSNIRIGYSQTDGSVSGEAKTDWSGSAALRIGYLVTPNTMLFSSFGGLVVHGVASWTGVGAGDVFGHATEEDVYYGVAIGALGIETKVASGLRLRVQYLDGLLNVKSYRDGVPFEIQPQIGSGRLSLIYAFNDDNKPQDSKLNFIPKWTGFHVAGSLGREHSISRYELGEIEDYNFYLDGFGSSGVSISGSFGADIQIGSRVVIGAELNAANSTDHNRFTYIGFGFQGNNTLNYGGRIRAGVLIWPETLAYGYVGASRNDSNFEIVAGNLPVSEYPASFHRTSFDFGGGLETFIEQNMSIRVEYGVRDFEKIDLVSEIPEYGSLDHMTTSGNISLVVHF